MLLLQIHCKDYRSKELTDMSIKMPCVGRHFWKPYEQMSENPTGNHLMVMFLAYEYF